MDHHRNNSQNSLRLLTYRDHSGQIRHMERLRDHTKRIAFDIQIHDALSDLDRFYFDKVKPRRLISGIAISSSAPNENKDAFVARGVNFSLPVPLLWNHEWHRPLGRVLAIEARGDQLRFNAEVANGSMSWVEQIWQEIVAQNVAMASIQGMNLSEPAIGGMFTRWELAEISVVQFGADPGAIIEKVWERAPVVYLDRPSETVHWSASC